MNMNRLIALLVLVSCSIALGSFSARAEIEIREISSPKGVKAWLVEDYTIPLIAINFAFKGGTSQDPAGKVGFPKEDVTSRAADFLV